MMCILLMLIFFIHTQFSIMNCWKFYINNKQNRKIKIIKTEAKTKDQVPLKTFPSFHFQFIALDFSFDLIK